MLKKIRFSIGLFGIILLTMNCSPIISTYDKYSYSQTTSLKVDALSIMGAALEEYSKHGAEAKAVDVNIQDLRVCQAYVHK